MKLLLWLSPLFSIADEAEEVQLEEIETMPRSERFPAHPPHDEIPVDYCDLVERDRQRNVIFYL